ncbi:MAG TPA: CBO2463/CBO2479 domain-containing protein [Clostridia bacterium]|nr:CBO2463/CBO2479 domain-containing protein [Clostridia bacterium]
MDRLKYASSESFYEGIVVDFSDCSVTVDFKGRMGQIKVPRRMVISPVELMRGQQVGFMMTYIEVLDSEPDEEYARSAVRQLEAKRSAEENYKKHIQSEYKEDCREV